MNEVNYQIFLSKVSIMSDPFQVGYYLN